MYNLGEQFKIDYEKAMSNEECVFRGKKYRFTVLSERTIRLEYSEEGIFEDRPTECILYRNFEKKEFEVKETEHRLEIKTLYFHLIYDKEKPFYGGKITPGKNLKVELIGTDRYWYYGHPEIRNYGAPGIPEENLKKQVFKKSLYSGDGFVSIDDAKSKIFLQNGELTAREKKQIDIYLFMYNKDFESCLTDFFHLTGYPALIPRYALGNWWTKNDTYDDYTLKGLLDQFEENAIPLSIVLLNRFWSVKTGSQQYGYTFDTGRFKTPKDMVAYLHSKGIRLGLTINPFEGLFPVETEFEKACTYVAKDKRGIIPFHVYDPKIIDVYFKLFIHPLDAIGIDFYFLDHFNLKNIDELSLIRHYQFHDMRRNYKKRPMVLAYNSLIAPHRYPILYAGVEIVSWDTLKKIPFYNASAANIGVSWWSHDIGGFQDGTEDNELFTRFVQMGTFSPIMKLGSDQGKYYKRAPWKWDVKTKSITEKYLNLRHKLIPYIYSEAYKYHLYGTPLIQPLYYKVKDFYDDPLYRNSYFFGSSFFVSPIVSKKDPIMDRVIHKFFVPEGTWYDFLTGKRFSGGKEYVSFFKDDEYPVFAKSGSIIPMGYNENINDTNPPKNMEIQFFPGNSSTYALYEDDGISSLYKEGYFLYSKIEYNYTPDAYTVIIRPLEGKSGIVPERRNYRFIFRNTKMAKEVVAYFNQEKIEATSYVEGKSFIIEVKNVNTIGQLTIFCKGKNLEIDAIRLINEEIEGIISDLPILTSMKEKLDQVLFSDRPIKKKRIELRKLRNTGLEQKFIKLFLKLLEYVDQV